VFLRVWQLCVRCGLWRGGQRPRCHLLPIRRPDWPVAVVEAVQVAVVEAVHVSTMPAPLDFSLLRQFSSESLAALLKSLAGDKDLILEQHSMRCLNKVVGMEVLKGCGVRKVFRLDGYKLVGPPGSTSLGGSPTKVFVLQASLAQATKVIDLVKVRLVMSRATHSEFISIFVYALLRQRHVLDRCPRWCWSSCPRLSKAF
jgi:hypothetical protein